MLKQNGYNFAAIWMPLVILALVGCQNRVEKSPAETRRTTPPIEIVSPLIAVTPASPAVSSKLPLSAVDVLKLADALDRSALKLAPNDLSQARILWAEAKSHYERAMKLAPLDAEVFYSYAISLGDQAEVLANIDMPAARALWAEAGLTYMKALEKDPREHDVLNSWGLDLAAEARAIQDFDLVGARALWRLAGEKYAQALLLKPDKHGAANNWGNALNQEALAVAKVNLVEARTIWREAEEKYAWSIRIKPDKYNAMSNWGGSRLDEAAALTKAGFRQEAEEGRKIAEGIYHRALAINPDFPDALAGYGMLLAAQAENLVPRDASGARLLLAKARQSYARAMAVDARNYTALMSWATAWEMEAGSFGSAQLLEAHTAWEKAIEGYRGAIVLAPNGADAYVGLGNSLAGKAGLLASAEGQREKARALWPEVDAAYRQAMTLKPSEMAAENWAQVSRRRVQLVKATDPGESRVILRETIQLLEKAQVLFPQNKRFPQLSGYCYFDDYSLADSQDVSRAERLRLLQAAQAQFAKAVSLGDGFPSEFWGNWGLSLLFESRLYYGYDEQRCSQLMTEAAKTLAKAVAENPAEYSPIYNLATAYDSLASLHSATNPAVASDFYNRAEQACVRAGQISPDLSEPRVLLIRILCFHASLQAPRNYSRAIELCRRADDLFAALTAKHSFSGGDYWNFANARARQAEVFAYADFQAALRAFAEASLNYQKATQALGDAKQLHLNWGQSLQAKAMVLVSRDVRAARVAWAEAREKYAKEIQANGSVAHAEAETGLAFLREYACLPTGQQFANTFLLAGAEQALLNAEALAAGSGSYNLACVFAWRNSPPEVVRWLEHANVRGQLPSREVTLNDGYLRRVAHSPEFKAWAEKTYSNR